MASAFPGGYDALDDAPASLAGPPLHEDLHDDQRDAIAAVQTAIGIIAESRLVQRFADAAARDAAITAPVDGMLAFTTDNNSLWLRHSGAWVDVANQWTGSITVTLTGDAAGSVTFDGSQNRNLNVTVGNNSHTHDSSTISGLQASDTTSGTFHVDRIPNHSANKLTSGTVNNARLPDNITDKTLVEADEFRADKNGTASDPAYTWQSDQDLGIYRYVFDSSGAEHRGLGIAGNGERLLEVFWDADAGVGDRTKVTLNDELQGISGTAPQLTTVTIGGTPRIVFGHATSSRRYKSDIQPFGLTDDEWDALEPRSFIRDGYHVDPDNGGHVLAVDEPPAGAVPLRRAGGIWEEMLQVNPMLVTDRALDLDACVAACMAEIKNLRARLAELEQ